MTDSGQFQGLTINDIKHNHKYDVIDTYVARCYGREGDEPGEVPVAVAAVTVRGTEREAWGAFEVPDECTNLIGVYATRDEAVAAAELWCRENDEG